MANIRVKKAIPTSWFVSEQGKGFSFILAGIASSAVLTAQIGPQTFLVERYRNFYRLYNKGFSVPVPEKLYQRFEKTLNLLQLPQADKVRYSPFMTSGFDMFSAGTFGRFGVYIGMPVNFTYDSVNHIDKSKIMVNQESVIWETDAGQQLLNALVVPESAQMYAIAAEVKMRQSWKVFFDTFYASMGCALTYMCSGWLNEKFNLYHKPRQIRFIGYALILTFNLVNYVMLKDITQNVYEDRIDKELKALNPIFAEGGKLYFTKILERNKALRELMGKEGEKVFTVNGNDNYLIRNKHKPIVQRKEFFEEVDEEQEETTLKG